MENIKFNLEINQEMLSIIMKGIDELSIKEGLSTRNEIIRQVQEFNKEHQNTVEE